MLGEKLQQAIKDSNKSVEEVALYIGITKQNLYKLFTKTSFDTDYLLKVCEFLELPLSHFFENSKISDTKLNEIYKSKKNDTKSNDINTKLLEIIEELRDDKKSLQEDKKCLQEDKSFLQKELDFFKRIVSQKLDIGDKELAKYRTNEQGSLDRDVCGRFGFVSGGVREVEVLPSVAAGSSVV
jgi:transcriptional regulator with XRE-family HTH domain